MCFIPCINFDLEAELEQPLLAEQEIMGSNPIGVVCGYSSMVERRIASSDMRVRVPLAAVCRRAETEPSS